MECVTRGIFEKSGVVFFANLPEPRSIMGCTQSAVDHDFNISDADPEKLAVFGAKYLVPPEKPMVLYLKPQFWGHIYPGNFFEVMDVNDNSRVIFSVDNTSVTNRKQTVLDESNQVVFHLDNKRFMFGAPKVVLREDQEMFRLSCNLLKIRQKIKNLKNLSGEPLQCRGCLNMLRMKGTIWYKNKETGKEISLAKICTPQEATQIVSLGTMLDESKDTYYVVIYPGVDAAFVLACILTTELCAYLTESM